MSLRSVAWTVLLTLNRNAVDLVPSATHTLSVIVIGPPPRTGDAFGAEGVHEHAFDGLAGADGE